MDKAEEAPKRLERNLHEMVHRDERIKQLEAELKSKVKEIKGLQHDIKMLVPPAVKQWTDGPRNCWNCKKCRDYKSDWYTSIDKPCSRWRSKVR